MQNLIKFREISFDPMHPDPCQAESAMFFLNNVPGVKHLSAPSPLQLVVHYDITHITLADILDALHDEGFHLYGSITCKLKQALFQYTEETQRANLGLSGQATRDVFVTHHKRRPHGCRDQRPRHWRHYR